MNALDNRVTFCWFFCFLFFYFLVGWLILTLLVFLVFVCLFCYLFIGLVWFGFKAWLSCPTPSYPVNSGAFANCIMLSVWVLRGCGIKIFQSLGTMQVYQRHLRNPALESPLSLVHIPCSPFWLWLFFHPGLCLCFPYSLDT